MTTKTFSQIPAAAALTGIEHFVGVQNNGDVLIPLSAILSSPSPWIDMTSGLLNGWVPYGLGYAAPAYYKDQLGRVHLRGSIKSGTTAVACFQLPAGYRPSSSGTLAFATVSSTGANTEVDIQTDGSVIPQQSSTYKSLDGISFLAEA